jgi:hypothetical protein
MLRMRPPGVVEVQIPADRRLCLGNRVVGPEVDLLVFHRPPQPLDEHIAPPGTLAVHADLDLVLLQQAGERLAGELTTLDALLNVKLRLGPDGSPVFVV